MQQIIQLFDISAVSDFVKTKTQCLPVSVAYLRIAFEQISKYIRSISLAGVSIQFKQYIGQALNSIEYVLKNSRIPADMLLSAYEQLHIVIVLLLLHYYIFIDSVCDDIVSKLRQCLVYINAGDMRIGIGMCESLLPVINE